MFIVLGMKEMPQEIDEFLITYSNNRDSREAFHGMLYFDGCLV